MFTTVQTRLQRFPGGSVTAREFSVALVQELDKVYDLEPIFYTDFTGYLQEQFPEEGDLDTGIREAEDTKKIVHTPTTRIPTTQLSSSDFTLRMLKLLRRRGTFRFSIPDVSPLLELDEITIAACEAEARSLGLKHRDEQQPGDVSDDDNMVLVAKPSNDDTAGNREKARHFEILQKKLNERWESQVAAKWLAMQPLYFNKHDGAAGDEPGQPNNGSKNGLPPHLRGDETRLQYFSHVDVLTFCVLDLFKCASASGPGGNTGDWTPYEAIKGSSESSSKQGRTSSFATLGWQRLLMFLAECSPSLGGADATLDGVRVFYPPQSYTLHPRGVAHTGRPSKSKKGSSEVSHHKHVDLGQIVQTAGLKRQHAILSAAPRDGGGCEMLHFLDGAQRCTRSLPLPPRWGAALCFEPVEEAGAVAVAFVSGIYILDMETAQPRAFMKEPETVTCMRWVPGMKALCVGSRVGNIRVYSGLLALDRGQKNDVADPLVVLSALPSLSFVDKLLHTDAISFIHSTLLLGGSLVSSSLDGRLSLWNLDTGFVRHLDGAVVAFGFDIAENLSLIFAFGVDLWPFVYTYDVPNSLPVSLVRGGTVIGSGSSAAASSSVIGGRKVRPHTSRIAAVATLRYPRNAAISMDQNGGIRIWDLWQMTMLQAVEISVECPNPHGFRWSSLGHFPGLLYDREKGRVTCYIRKYCITLDYNFKDDLRTTRNASFQPINHLHYCPSNRTVVTFTTQVLTVWSMATGQKLHSLSIPSLFLSSSGGELPTADGDDDEIPSVQAVVSERRMPGLDIECVQVIDDSRMALVGLKGGGIVVVSLGNANVICYVPPVAAFSGGDGLFTTDGEVGGEVEALTTVQSIASTAVVGGDLRVILYVSSCDTLFMSGAGRTFYEHHGQRKELLAKNNISSIDASAMIFHSFCGMLIIAEDSGEVSVWTQHDAILNPDTWLEVAHINSPLEGITGMVEVANTPSFVVYDAKGNLTLWDVTLGLSLIRKWRPSPSCSSHLLPDLPLPVKLEVDCTHNEETSCLSVFDMDSPKFDPTFAGFFYWPGAYQLFKDLDGNQSDSHTPHPRFAELFSSPCDRSIYDSPEIEARRLFRKVGLPRELHILNNSPLFDELPEGVLCPDAASPIEKAGVAIPQMSMVYLRRLARRRPDIMKSIVESFNRLSEGDCTYPLTHEELDSATSLPTTCNGFVQLKLRQHWCHTAPSATHCAEAGSTKSAKRRQSSRRPHESTRVDLGSTLYGLSVGMGQNDRLPSSCRLPVKVHSSQRHEVEKCTSSVTCGAYEGRYRLFYCGDASGRVAIYDLSFAVTSPLELFRVWSREFGVQRGFQRRYATGVATLNRLTESGASKEAKASTIGLLGDLCTERSTFDPTCDAFGSRQVTCIRNCQVNTSAAPVTSVRLANLPYPYVITSDARGFVMCWSLYLNTQCGVVSLGEESCLSPLRYATLPIDSPLSRRLLKHVELGIDEVDADDTDSSVITSASASFRVSRRSRHLEEPREVPSTYEDAGSTEVKLSSIAHETEALLVFPQQVFVQVLSAVKDSSLAVVRLLASTAKNGKKLQSTGRGAAHPSDPGWASQIGADSGEGKSYKRLWSEAHSEYSSSQKQSRTSLSKKSEKNTLTRAMIKLMSEVLIDNLTGLCKVSNTPEEDLGGDIAQELVNQMKALVGGGGFGEKEQPLENSQVFTASASISRIMKKAKAKPRQHKTLAQEWQDELQLPSQHFVVTKGGVDRFFCREEGRLGVYDDIPQPYNRLGPVEVHQRLPTRCLSFLHVARNRSLAGSATSFPVGIVPLKAMSSAHNLMLDLNTTKGDAFEDGGTATATKEPSGLEGVQAVIKYKEWYLDSVGKLEDLSRQYNLPELQSLGSPTTADSGKSSSKPVQSQPTHHYRLSEALSLFHSMYNVGVGDAATLTRSSKVTKLPPIRSKSVPLESDSRYDDSPTVNGRRSVVYLSTLNSMPPLGSPDIGRRARVDRAREASFFLSLDGAKGEDCSSSEDEDVDRLLKSLSAPGTSKKGDICSVVPDFTPSQLSRLSHTDFKSYMNHCTAISKMIPPKSRSSSPYSTPPTSEKPSVVAESKFRRPSGFQGSKPIKTSKAGGGRKSSQ